MRENHKMGIEQETEKNRTVWYRSPWGTAPHGNDVPTSLDHDTAPELPYDEDNREPSVFRCHWGQRKLFFGELDFLLEVFSPIDGPDPGDTCVVYVGAASGDHLNLLIPLFPGLEWQLYDAAPFRIDPALLRQARVQTFTGRDGFVREGTMRLARQRTRRKHMLFISDVRRNTQEESVERDMRLQQEWGAQLRADFMLLKMRLPYHGADLFDYLDGEIRLQLYAPMHSTETRLLVRRKAHGSPYPTRTYHCARYQNQLFYFNEVVRQQVFCIPDGIQLSQHLPGYDNAYEAVREYQLATKYLQWRKQSSNTPHVLELLSRWSSTLQSLSRDRSLWGGGIQTLRTYVEARISEPALSSPTMARARTWLSMASPYLSWVCERQAVLLEEQAQSNHQLRAPELYLRDAAALRTYARTLQNIDS